MPRSIYNIIFKVYRDGYNFMKNINTKKSYDLAMKSINNASIHMQI